MSAMTAVAGACGSHGKGAMEGADSEEAGPERGDRKSPKGGRAPLPEDKTCLVNLSRFLLF